jgi:phosphate/sulfate permease
VPINILESNSGGNIVNKKTKRVFWGFLSIDYKAMEAYLEEMAEKGWMLEKIGSLTAKFKAIEPKKYKFCVDIFEGGGPLTPENTSEAIEYRKRCQELGWSFIASQDYLQFFCIEEGAYLSPIREDEKQEQKIVESTLIKREVLSCFFTLAILIAVMFMIFPVQYKQLLSFVGISGIFVLPLLAITTTFLLVYVLIRNFKAKKNIKRDLPLERPTLKDARKNSIIFYYPTFILAFLIILSFIADSFFRPYITVMSLIGPVIGVVIGICFKRFYKKKTEVREDIVLYVILSIVAAAVLAVTASSIISRNYMDSLNKRDAIGEDYPTVTMSELLQSPLEGEPVYRKINTSMSPVVLKHYSIREIRQINGKEEGVYVSYYKTISPYISKIIFDGIVKELERGIKIKKNVYLQTKTVVIDNEMMGLWNVENLAITETKKEIIVRKGNIVVHLSGDIDFNDVYIRELINNRFLL